MPYAVELLFDKETEEYIYGIWDILHRTGLNRYMIESGGKPHITLAIYDTVNYPRFEERVEHFFGGVEGFPLNFSSVGMFPGGRGTVFLAPTVTSGLLDVHGRFHHAFKDHDDLAWEYYKPGLWVPHCTVSTDTDYETAIEVLNLINETFRGMTAQVNAVVIVKFRPIKHMLYVKLGC
ncbi:MAG: hypothetical protein HPY66_2734 [Firmicutes bacterium]|nr:hypothetical protein [Bacillota bacterium]MDI6706107.1 2'-5' RNA ligase family protein [Bacillota bacterium]